MNSCCAVLLIWKCDLKWVKSLNCLGDSKCVYRSELLRSPPPLSQRGNLHEHRTRRVPLRLSTGILWQDLSDRWAGTHTGTCIHTFAVGLLFLFNQSPINTESNPQLQFTYKKPNLQSESVRTKSNVLLFLLYFDSLHQPSTPVFPILAPTVVHATRFPQGSSASVRRAGRVRLVPTVSRCTTFYHLHSFHTDTLLHISLSAIHFSSVLSALQNSSLLNTFFVIFTDRTHSCSAST